MNEAKSLLIDKYLQGTLSGEEQERFQTLMQEETFAEEVHFRSMIGIASQQEGREQLKSLFQQADAELDEEASAPIVPMRSGRQSYLRWGSLAAVVLALLVFFLWPSSSSDADLFNKHYQAFPNLIAPADRSGAEKELLAQALQAYDREAYVEALRLFEQLPERNQNERLYLALSLLQTKRIAEAIPLLESISKDPEARYQEAAQWYLALAFLKQGNRTAAEEGIHLILSLPDHRYRDQAQALQEEL